MNKREAYVQQLFVKEDEVLRSIEPGLSERGMPKISVSPHVGKTLHMLVRITGARRVLEIGTLGGYSTIWLSRALPEEGRLVSLELSADHAAFARENVERAGLADRVEIRVGDAKESLQQLADEGETFDFFLIDADKESYLTYWEWAIRLARPGAVITADNALLHDLIFEENVEDERARAILHFNEAVSRDDRVEAMLLPFGDGLLVAQVKD
ncbi:O-methyltransferase [Polycladomyces subterraneus]|uniref:O-methyltransferase n=1 Tax=Polycladomyces subterraneus TaxID=1016997 RepID=A0ABT8IQS8_9BACL|nr:O-methyltransferase [Polycladomyces subterraneus]MDN4594856.1 O-methyltransferase [Polycladomyces subterraneus]